MKAVKLSDIINDPCCNPRFLSQVAGGGSSDQMSVAALAGLS